MPDPYRLAIPICSLYTSSPRIGNKHLVQPPHLTGWQTDQKISEAEWPIIWLPRVGELGE